MLIPTGGQRGSMPLARPPPAHVEQYPSTNVFSYGNNHTLIEAKIKICTNVASTYSSEADPSDVHCIISLQKCRTLKTRINNCLNYLIFRECLKVCRLWFEAPINQRVISLPTSCLSDHLSPSCHSNFTTQVFLRKEGKSQLAPQRRHVSKSRTFHT